MKRSKKLQREYQRRLADWENTTQSRKLDPKAYRRPGKYAGYSLPRVEKKK